MSRNRGTDEIFLEFWPIGNQVKVVAIHAATGLEVSVFGPASASQEDLKMLAVRKLQRQLSKAGESGDADTPADPTLF